MGGLTKFHQVLEWKQPAMLEEEQEEGGQSGWGVHRECWNSVKGGQEGKRANLEGPAGYGKESGFYVMSGREDILKGSYEIT